MNELKPCPFCGGKAKTHEEQNWSGVKCWSAYCANEQCPLENVWASGFDTEESVVAVWNHRPLDELMKKTTKKLLDNMKDSPSEYSKTIDENFWNLF